MPRTGKGQKIQTATGQQYGAASEQAEAQRVVPLAENEPGPPPGASAAPAPGAAPFARPTERPNQIGSGPAVLSPQSPTIDPQRRFRAAMMLPMLEQMASQDMASPYLRNTVRKLKLYVGDTADFADRNPAPEKPA